MGAFAKLFASLGTAWLLTGPVSAAAQTPVPTPVPRSCTVPVTLDHNRMLVDAEMRRKDGTWRTVRLWVDTGNPDCFLSEALAADLGIDVPATQEKPADGRPSRVDVPPPADVRLGGMPLRFAGVKTMVMSEPKWLFSTMHNDANLPATVLARYQVVMDYPGRRLTLAEPGSLEHRGVRAPAAVHPTTGIVQLDATLDGESLGFALDNGASFSFVSSELVTSISGRHPGWPRTTGAVGCANIWGWWPGEADWPLVRVPTLVWGGVSLGDVALAGVPAFFPDGSTLGAWYSHKTARPVAGILGPNAFKTYRIEIDYAGSAVYFEKTGEIETHDLDIVGLTLRQEADGSYRIIGVSSKAGTSLIGEAVGGTLLQVDDVKATGATMGTIVDALRGTPGEVRTLVVRHQDRTVTVKAVVERFL